MNRNSTGAVKKTLEHNVDKVETFIAQKLPDLVHAAVTTILMITVMYTLNVWLALACIVPIILGFTVQIALISGLKTKENLKQYYDSLKRLNASAVPYVRWMPVVKCELHMNS